MKIRKMAQSDIPFVADLIRSGRKEKVFSSQYCEIDDISFLSKSLKSTTYWNWVIEENKEILGYADYEILPDNQCHILGLYIAKKFRGYGKGKALINFVLDTLKNKGVCRVFTEVYFDNHLMKSILEKYGFVYKLSKEEKESGHLVEEWEKYFDRGSNPYHNLFLKENYAKKYFQIANEFVKKVDGDSNIIGIVLCGGVARGRADIFSDIDLSIFSHNINKLNLRQGEQLFNGATIDLFLVDLNQVRNKKWTQTQREVYKFSKILYDTNHSTERLIKENLTFPEEERIYIVVKKIFELAWAGIYPRDLLGKKWRGYTFPLPHDIMCQRGEPDSSHINLLYSLDNIVQILFAINSEFIPDHKWRYFRVKYLYWLPSNFIKNFQSIIVCNNISTHEFERRYKLLKNLYDEVIEKALTEKLIPDDIYGYLINTMQEYNSFQP
jgi:GNAT superfamily N-acetyltransferase